MVVKGPYLDSILRKLYNELSKSTDTFEATKGKGRDLLAPTIILTDPRARISATVSRGRLISALGEFCWHMRGSADLDFIRFYIRDYPSKNVTASIEEAYGPRLIGTGEFDRSFNQIERVIQRLQCKPDTRRAVISILEPSDLEPDRREAPCTTALQFIRRRERLHMIAMMRSNDAYLGFPHDVFCFTMIQELVASSLGIKVGEYHHFATSLHLYEHDIDKVTTYLREGLQNPKFSMPRMPSGCQQKNLCLFLKIERLIRTQEITDAKQIRLPPYWRDLALILLRYTDTKMKRGQESVEENFSNISNDFYKNFFMEQPRILQESTEEKLVQDTLDLGNDGAHQN